VNCEVYTASLQGVPKSESENRVNLTIKDNRRLVKFDGKTSTRSRPICRLAKN